MNARATLDEDLARMALDVAIQAGAEILRHRAALRVEQKADGSDVTQADRASEMLLRRELRRLRPATPIIGEEFGGDADPRRGEVWIIDPLDGTTPFALGLPTFGVLIALLREGRPQIGVIHLPAVRESMYAWPGDGCWHLTHDSAPQRVRVAPTDRLQEAAVAVGGIYSTEVQPSRGRPNYSLARLAAAARRTRVIGDCVQHSLLCRGLVQVTVDPIVAPWDVAALLPCIREAGGVAASLEGGRDDVTFAGSLIAAASDALLAQALQVMTVVPATIA